MAALGCDDPLVLYLLSRAVAEEEPQSAETESLLTRSLEGMEVVAYPRAVARFVASGLYVTYEFRNEGIGLREPLRQLEARWFEESLGDGSYGPDDDVVLTWQLLNGTGPGFFRRSRASAVAAIERADWIDPWVRLHYSGLAHSREAWEARGHGWAKDVKPEAWKAFEAAAALARRDLEEAWRLRPDRPEAAYEMISASTDSPAAGESARFWFDRAVAAQMDFIPAYTTLLKDLLPRWGGSYEQMLAFGREALDTRRFDTDVPLVLLDAVKSVADDQSDEEGGTGGEPVFAWPQTYPLLVRMLEGYSREPSRAQERSRFESLWAVVADRAGRKKEALDHLAAAGYHLHPDAVWRLKRETPEEFVGRVALQAGEGAADAERGDALRAAFDSVGAISAYEASRRKEPSPHVARLLRGRIAALRIEEALEAGRWTRLLPDSPDLAGWKQKLGTWRVTKDGSLVGTSGRRGLLITSDARVGPEFEVRGRLELVASSNGAFQGGIAFGHPAWETRDWLSFRMKRNPREGSVAYFSQHFDPPDYQPETFPIPDVNDFLVRSESGKLTAILNGRIVKQALVPTKGLVRDGDALLGFGAYLDENVFSLRFRNVEVRRLH